MSVQFCSIASGSSGNCMYVGTEDTNILIDAGLSGIKIESGLTQIAVDPKKLDAIFITHEHGDHIVGAGVLSRRYDVPIYATEKTWKTLLQGNMVGKIKQHNMMYIYPDENCAVNDVLVRPFKIPHDAIDPVGYQILAEGKKISVATDIGHITEELRENISDSDCLLIESNHDVEMLKNGPYPYHLKKRVLGDFGHLSNHCAGQLLVDVMSQKLKHIYLGHLSRENNRPLLALETVTRILEENKINVEKDLHLTVAVRGFISNKLVL